MVNPYLFKQFQQKQNRGFMPYRKPRRMGKTGYGMRKFCIFANRFNSTD